MSILIKYANKFDNIHVLYQAILHKCLPALNPKGVCCLSYTRCQWRTQNKLSDCSPSQADDGAAQLKYNNTNKQSSKTFSQIKALFWKAKRDKFFNNRY